MVYLDEKTKLQFFDISITKTEPANEKCFIEQMVELETVQNLRRNLVSDMKIIKKETENVISDMTDEIQRRK